MWSQWVWLIREVAPPVAAKPLERARPCRRYRNRRSESRLSQDSLDAKACFHHITRIGPAFHRLCTPESTVGIVGRRFAVFIEYDIQMRYRHRLNRRKPAFE